MFTAIVPAMTKSDFSKCECRHCAGHIEFPTAAGGQSIACPHCGQTVELPQVAVLTRTRQLPGRGIIALWVVIIVVAIGLYAMKVHYPVTSAGKTPEQS